jgi:hypothetical protein
LKTVDTSAFWGWKVIIDEVPTIWQSESVNTPALRHQLEQTYDLVQSDNPAWRKIVPKAGAVTASDLNRDDTMREWAAFHRAASSKHGVYTEIKTWAETVTDRWRWWFIWSPLELRPFAARYIVANAVESSVTYRLIRSQWPEVTWTPFQLSSSQTWQHRNLTIRYFVTRHIAGSSFWASPDGLQSLIGWAHWIAANTIETDHIWAVNKKSSAIPAVAKIHGRKVSTKIAGSNDFRDITTASIAYSAKPDSTEIGVFRAFGISPEMVTRAREYEDLIQVLFRTSIRNPTDRRDVTWNVYDKRQAEFLADYLKANGFPITVNLVFEDVGIDIPAIDKTIRAKLRTPDEREALIARARETDAQRKRRVRAEKRAALGLPLGKPGRKKCPVRQAEREAREVRRLEREALTGVKPKRKDK